MRYGLSGLILAVIFAVPYAGFAAKDQAEMIAEQIEARGVRDPRVLEAFRGISANLSRAAKRSSAGKDWSAAFSISRDLRPEYFFASLRRFLSRSMELFFAIQSS